MEDRIKKLQKIPVRITQWIGTMGSIFLHTMVFGTVLVLPWLGIAPFDEMLLVMTTILSIEAIYLAIFIQMTVNRHAESLEDVQEDVQEISEDVEGLSVDVDEISQDVEEISEDVDKIQEEDQKDEAHEVQTKVTLEKIESGLQKILVDIENLKQQKHDLDTLRQQKL